MLRRFKMANDDDVIFFFDVLNIRRSSLEKKSINSGVKEVDKNVEHVKSVLEY